MYIFRTDNDFVIITIWVDDMLLFVMTVELKQKAIVDMESEWEITDMGMPTKIIGIKLKISLDEISISSSSYIKSILEKELLERCNLVSMLLDPNVPLELNPEGNKGN